MCVNKRVVCVAFRERVVVMDARSMRERLSLVSCYPSPGVHTNPMALHDRWLAFADKSLCVSRKSAGGMEGGVNQSVTAWGINVGSKLASGVTKFCSNILTGSVALWGILDFKFASAKFTPPNPAIFSADFCSDMQNKLPGCVFFDSPR